MCWTHYWKGCLDFEYCRGSLFKQAKKCAWFDCYLSTIASTNKLQKGNFSQLVDWMFRYIFQSLAFQESNVLFAQMKIFDLRYIFSLHNLVGTLQSFCIEKEPYMFEKIFKEIWWNQFVIAHCFTELARTNLACVANKNKNKKGKNTC